MVRVLIVDDSPVAQQLMAFVLGQDPEITVIGIAQNGEEAIQAVRDKRPDIVTMDINMPVMNGLEATRRIMKTMPVPIVIVTGNENIIEVVTSFAAMGAGAVTMMARPPGLKNPEFENSAMTLRNVVKTYAKINLVRGYPTKTGASTGPAQLTEELRIKPQRDQAKIVAIGASTGGPAVLQTRLSGFLKTFPLPVVIVQHIAQGFTEGLTSWLDTTTGFPVHMAVLGEELLPGHAYIAPEGFQMGVTDSDQVTLLHLDQERGICPSVAYLFRSVREVYADQAIAILLTGMGRDGADELKNLKDAGAITIAQDEYSSVVFGMPGEAIRQGGATYILSPEKIVDTLNKIVHSGGDDPVTIS
ncbi:MAG: chemotaxis-specific protein-glutamate methyltransferase CheB [Methanobacteriota archaeon]